VVRFFLPPQDDQCIKQIAKIHALGVKEIVALNKKRRGMKGVTGGAELKGGTHVVIPVPQPLEVMETV